MNRLERIQLSLTKKMTPKFGIGDTVRVHVKVVEGEKERIQVYEGTVIARKGTLNSETFTVRKLSYNVGVEQTFPPNFSFNSGKLDSNKSRRRRHRDFSVGNKSSQNESKSLCLASLMVQNSEIIPLPPKKPKTITLAAYE